MKRLIRFTKLFLQYFKHIWYASKFEHSFYLVHGTNSLKEHKAELTKVTKVTKNLK